MKGFSRALRKNQTKEEALLWYRFLSKHQLRFRRQYIIGPYIVDFYCHKAKLAVELDGSQHYTTEQVLYDRNRTAYLESLGVKVLRFANTDVTGSFYQVCQAIDDETKKRFSRGEAVSVAD